MRARLYTAGGTLGFVELVDGADVAEVVRAMRENRLYIARDESRPLEPVATALPAARGVTLPDDKTIDDCLDREPSPRRRRSPA